MDADMNGAHNILCKAFPEAIMADKFKGHGLVSYSLNLKDLNKLKNLNPLTEALPKADGISQQAVGCALRSQEASGSKPFRDVRSDKTILLKFVNNL